MKSLSQRERAMLGFRIKGHVTETSINSTRYLQAVNETLREMVATRWDQWLEIASTILDLLRMQAIVSMAQ